MSADTHLCDREAAFVAKYLVSLNPMDAYIKAGYAPKSARVNAYRMMDRDSIQRAIAREDAKTRQRVRIPRKMGTDSTRSRALVPRHRGQPFHAKVGS